MTSPITRYLRTAPTCSSCDGVIPVDDWMGGLCWACYERSVHTPNEAALGAHQQQGESRETPIKMARAQRWSLTCKSSTFHLVFTWLLAILVVPLWLWWRDSIVAVMLMSWYALVNGQWAIYEAARAKEAAEKP